jgi:acyl-coenzyme A thioesterase PaaI-like protein
MQLVLAMNPRRSDYAEYVRAIFASAPFIRDLGIELVDLGPGSCETALTIAPRLLQQHGFVHAGVTTTLADHTAGGAAGTLIGADEPC